MIKEEKKVLSTNTIIFLAMLLIALVLYFINMSHPQTAILTPQSDTSTMSVSMICVDGSHFIAEFPASGNLEVYIDGVLAKTLPPASGDGKRFEDSNSSYVFAGEEVTVTTKSPSSLTTCHQPFDPNNAPINFGDAGEGASTKPDLVSIVNESIIGGWQSTEDPKFTRTFNSDNSTSDLYNTEEVSTGTWKLFTKETAPAGITTPLEPGVTYVQIIDTKDPTQILNFKINKVTPDELELIYLDRGNTLKFKRVAG